MPHVDVVADERSGNEVALQPAPIIPTRQNNVAPLQPLTNVHHPPAAAATSTKKKTRQTWTEDEDRTILQCFRKGYQWTQMAEQLPGRSAKSISNRWRSVMQQSVEKYIFDKNIDGENRIRDDDGQYLIGDDDIDRCLAAIERHTPKQRQSACALWYNRCYFRDGEHRCIRARDPNETYCLSCSTKVHNSSERGECEINVPEIASGRADGETDVTDVVLKYVEDMMKYLAESKNELHNDHSHLVKELHELNKKFKYENMQLESFSPSFTISSIVDNLMKTRFDNVVEEKEKKKLVRNGESSRTWLPQREYVKERVFRAITRSLEDCVREYSYGGKLSVEKARLILEEVCSVIKSLWEKAAESGGFLVLKAGSGNVEQRCRDQSMYPHGAFDTTAKVQLETELTPEERPAGERLVITFITSLLIGSNQNQVNEDIPMTSDCMDQNARVYLMISNANSLPEHMMRIADCLCGDLVAPGRMSVHINQNGDDLGDSSALNGDGNGQEEATSEEEDVSAAAAAAAGENSSQEYGDHTEEAAQRVEEGFDFDPFGDVNDELGGAASDVSEGNHVGGADLEGAGSVDRKNDVESSMDQRTKRKPTTTIAPLESVESKKLKCSPMDGEDELLHVESTEDMNENSNSGNSARRVSPSDDLFGSAIIPTHRSQTLNEELMQEQIFQLQWERRKKVFTRRTIKALERNNVPLRRRVQLQNDGFLDMVVESKIPDDGEAPLGFSQDAAEELEDL